jgi:hypothetical protein
LENLTERDNFGNSGAGGRIILKWILEKNVNWIKLIFEVSTAR